MKLALLVNPSAGRGSAGRRSERAEAAVASAANRTVPTYRSLDAADLQQKAASLSREVDRLIVFGGDGTVHHALREFDLSQCELAIIPGGSGDDFASAIGIPRSIEDAAELAIHGSARAVDVALVNGVRYLGIAGVGFDSLVAARARDVRGLRGPLVYLWSILRVLPRFRPIMMTVRDSATSATRELMFAVVANNRRYGGGIVIAPEAEIDDGKLDLVEIDRSSRLNLLLTLPLAYAGLHVKRRMVRQRRAENIEISTETPLEVYADGEPVSSTPARFSLLGERLRVVAAMGARR